MVKLSQIATDPKAEAEGVWLEYVPGLRLKIASTATRKFRDAMEAAMGPYRELIRSDKEKTDEPRRFTDEMRTRIVAEVMSENVLLGWEGLEDDDGASVPYSKAKAREILADPEQHRLAEWVEAAAGSEDAYRMARLETDRKNS